MYKSVGASVQPAASAFAKQQVRKSILWTYVAQAGFSLFTEIEIRLDLNRLDIDIDISVDDN